MAQPVGIWKVGILWVSGRGVFVFAPSSPASLIHRPCYLHIIYALFTRYLRVIYIVFYIEEIEYKIK